MRTNLQDLDWVRLDTKLAQIDLANTLVRAILSVLRGYMHMCVYVCICVSIPECGCVQCSLCHFHTH